jgi:uncharacterized membrane protein YhaH (DUF805 family)
MREIFSFAGRIGAVRFFWTGLALVFGKHVLNLLIATLVFRRPWNLTTYVNPAGPFAGLVVDGGDAAFFWTMLAVSIPFAWAGLALCAKRFRTVGWPAWTVIFFFVPVANAVAALVASALPDASDRLAGEGVRFRRWIPDSLPGAALAALCVTSLLGCFFAWLGIARFATYGWGVFAAGPFVQGALSAWLIGVHRERTLVHSIAAAFLSVSLSAAIIFAVAFEGAVCLLMALPLVYAFALIGALFGHCLQRRPGRPNPSVASLLVLIASAPMVMGAEAAFPREAPLYEVRTALVVDAPPNAVWRNVVSFPDLPPPKESLFRAGISYPKRAHIEGRGVGAVRYCEFSTGSFVEPITVWDENHVLAFDVVSNPEPMQEWTPYGHVDTPHLHGYMLSRRGRFDLEALPGGRTRLTGTTWYQHHLWPASYWRLWSDGVIHRIHYRVLDHIKHLSEDSL